MITNTLINKRYDIKHGAGSKGIKNHENVKLKTATMREYIFLDKWFCKHHIFDQNPFEKPAGGKAREINARIAHSLLLNEKAWEK